MRWDASPQDYFFKAVFGDSQLFTARSPECFFFGHRGTRGNLTTVGRRWQGKIIHRRRRAEPDGDLMQKRKRRETSNPESLRGWMFSFCVSRRADVAASRQSAANRAGASKMAAFPRKSLRFNRAGVLALKNDSKEVARRRCRRESANRRHGELEAAGGFYRGCGNCRDEAFPIRGRRRKRLRS